MNKTPKNQKGFTVVEVVIVLAVLILIGLAGYLVYKNHHKTLKVSVETSSKKPATCSSVISKWIFYTSVKGNFSVCFPGRPTTAPQTSQLEQQKNYTYTFNSVSFINENASYAVLFITYPNNVVLSTGDTVLNEIVEGEVNQVQGGQLVSSRYNTVDGHKGVIFEFTGTKGGTNFNFTNEVVQVGHVRYTASATSSSQAPNALNFISSFKLGQ